MPTTADHQLINEIGQSTRDFLETHWPKASSLMVLAVFGNMSAELIANARLSPEERLNFVEGFCSAIKGTVIAMTES